MFFFSSTFIAGEVNTSYNIDELEATVWHFRESMADFDEVSQNIVCSVDKYPFYFTNMLIIVKQFDVTEILPQFCTNIWTFPWTFSKFLVKSDGTPVSRCDPAQINLTGYLKVTLN